MSGELPRATVKELLDAGVHIGHNKSRWNPEMRPYIFGVDLNSNVHILNLRQTAPLMNKAINKIYDTAKKGGKVLFVGTKIRISDVVAHYVKYSGQFYINYAWVGGLLTNWNEVFVKNIKHLDHIENILSDQKQRDRYTKKEIVGLERKRKKLLKIYEGIRNMDGPPDLIVILDTNKDFLAIKEALKCGIPLISILDSNSDPRGIDIPVPGNDDAIRAVTLYLVKFCQAALMGLEASGANLKTEFDEDDAPIHNKGLNVDTNFAKSRNKGKSGSFSKFTKGGSGFKGKFAAGANTSQASVADVGEINTHNAPQSVGVIEELDKEEK